MEQYVERYVVSRILSSGCYVAYIALEFYHNGPVIVSLRF